MDRLMLGLATTGVGMLVVFSGLVILIACIYGLTSITGRKKKPKPSSAPIPAPAPVRAEPAAQAPEEEEDDMSVVAAITAAIAAVWQSENNDSAFVVRRIRRVQSSTARARAARDEQIYSRL